MSAFLASCMHSSSSFESATQSVPPEIAARRRCSMWLASTPKVQELRIALVVLATNVLRRYFSLLAASQQYQGGIQAVRGLAGCLPHQQDGGWILCLYGTRRFMRRWKVGDPIQLMSYTGTAKMVCCICVAGVCVGSLTLCARYQSREGTSCPCPASCVCWLDWEAQFQLAS